jgi:hypothetical protein
LTVRDHKFSKSAENYQGQTARLNHWRRCRATAAKDESQTGKGTFKLKKSDLNVRNGESFSTGPAKRPVHPQPPCWQFTALAPIPTPGINTDALQKAFEQQSGGLLGMISAGGNLRKLTIFRASYRTSRHHHSVADRGMGPWRACKKRRLGRRRSRGRVISPDPFHPQSMGIAFAAIADFVVSGDAFILMTIIP